MPLLLDAVLSSALEHTETLDAAAAADGTAIVSRSRLLQKMCRGVRGPLTVLAAPPGYGKRVAVRQWAAQHASSPVASLALREEDGAQTAAAKLLAAASRLGGTVDPFVLGCVPEGEASLGSSFTGAFVEWMATLGEAVLVVEALDAPRRVALVNELGSLLTQLPSNIHVVVTRKAPAPLPRAGDRDTVVLYASDLAFTAAEARVLVRRVAGVGLTDEQVEALVLRSGGWAVALKVAAISLRGGSDPDDVIDSVRGTERHIAAFLCDAVLDRQPPAVRRFLVSTSVLDTLNPSLCRAVTGEPAAGMMLRYLELGGAMTRQVSGDDDLTLRQPLLRDLLQQELRRTAPGLDGTLLGRAAAWHMRHGELDKAAVYLVEAEEWDQLVDLIDSHGRVLFERGKAQDMLGWLERVPVNPKNRHYLVFRLAFILSMIGETRRAAHVLRELDPRDMTAGDQLVVNVLRSMWGFIDAVPQAVLEAADAALEDLSAGVVRVIPDVLGMTSRANLLVMAEGARARALWQLGEVSASRDLFTGLARRHDLYPPWHVHLLSALALLEAWAGNLHLAEQHASKASALATSWGLLDHPAMLDSYIAMGHVCRERGDLSRGDKFLKKAGAVVVRIRRPVTASVLAVERGLWHLAAGKPERGLAEVRADRATGEAPPPPMVGNRLIATEAQLLLALGDTDQAQLVVEFAPRPFLAPMSCAAVQVEVARHDLVAAREHLEGWTVNEADARAHLERDLWTAIVDFEAGKRRTAVDRGVEVVRAARDERFLRLFLDGGRPAERLMRATAHAEPSRYVRNVARAAESHLGVGAPMGLSQRELEVVRYLPTPLSSAEIASRLYISLNTLKTHLRTIYRKLDVNGRREAIERAEQLGIA